MPPVSSPGSRYGADQGDPLARVRFRRALALLLMTLVLPGSAQLVAGSKRVGRIALRIWALLLAALVLVVVLGVMSRSVVYWLASDTVMLGFLRLLLCAVAVGWAVLFLDAWRLGQPLQLMKKQRLAMVAGILCASVVQSTNTAHGGGSSIVFRSALKASLVIWCASSMMKIL